MGRVLCRTQHAPRQCTSPLSFSIRSLSRRTRVRTSSIHCPVGCLLHASPSSRNIVPQACQQAQQHPVLAAKPPCVAKSGAVRYMHSKCSGKVAPRPLDHVIPTWSTCTAACARPRRSGSVRGTGSWLPVHVRAREALRFAAASMISCQASARGCPIR